jgi:hypothetical protein
MDASLLTRNRGGKQHDIRVPGAIADHDLCRLGCKVFRHLQADDEIKAPVEVEAMTQVSMQDQTGVDFQMTWTEVFVLDAKDMPSAVTGKGTQPCADATTKIEHRFRLDPAIEQIGDHHRGVATRLKEPTMIAQVRDLVHIIHGFGNSSRTGIID